MAPVSHNNILSRCCLYYQNSDFFSTRSTHTHVRQTQRNTYCYTQYLAMGGLISLSYLPELLTEVLYININVNISLYIIYNRKYMIIDNR